MSAAIQPGVSGPALSPKQRLRQRMRPVAEHAVLHLRGTKAEDALQRLCINRGSVPNLMFYCEKNTQIF